MLCRRLNTYYWDGSHWIVADIKQPHTSWPSQCNSGNSFLAGFSSHHGRDMIRLATLNILADAFPWFVEIAIKSKERYQHLCSEISALDPTIIGLNEVTPTALRVLQENSFIRHNYYITANATEPLENELEIRSDSLSVILPHGSILMSKLPLMKVFTINVTGSRREAVVAKVQLNNENYPYLHVCSLHTTAYQTSKNAKLRAQQIDDILKVLAPLSYPFIIMGDLNLHYSFEDESIINNHLIDAWAKTHFSQISPFDDQKPGFTFDAVTNTLVPYYIPGEFRRMRLDRILFSPEFPGFASKPCDLWANEPIRSDHYLFLSDHYGLTIDIIINSNNDRSKADRQCMPLNQLDTAVHKLLTHNALLLPETSGNMLNFLKRIFAMTSHIFWLGAILLKIRDT